MDAVGDARCVFQSHQQGMVLPCLAILLEIEIGVEHGTFNLAREGGTKERAESEVLAADTPLVVERCFICRNNASTVLDILDDLLALRRGERGYVWQDQCAELVDVVVVKQAVVDHLKWNSCLDKGLVEAERRIFNFCS